MKNPIRTDAGPSAGLSYIQLLEAGLGKLRFPEPLEREFHTLYLSRCRSRARFWQLFLVITGLIYGVSRLNQGALGSTASLFEILLRFAVLIPTWSILAWIAWNSKYERLYWPVARILVPVSSGLMALLMTILIVNGRGEALSGLATYMLGLMFLSGLLFRQALWVCGVMMLTFVAAATYEGTGFVKLLLDAVSPLMTLGIGGFVYYEIEKASRRAFLEQKHALEQASNDGLTGLKNRRAFDEHLRRVWEHAHREKRQLSLLLIDVDDFKRYNDRYGHQAGDKCLQRIAEVVQRFAVRPLDLAARFGGEELAVILYDMSADQVQRMGEGIRVAIEKLGIEHQDSRVTQGVTVSIGAACIHPARERSREGLVQLADEALYATKRTGRNRVTLMEDEYRFLSTGVFRHSALPPENPPGAC